MFAIIKVRLGTDEEHLELDKREAEEVRSLDSEEEEAEELRSIDAEEGEAEEQVPEETSGCASSQKCCNLL